MTEKTNCVFCNLDERVLISEDKNTLVILSNPYLVKGHCLVIPKEHYESLQEIPKNVLYELINETIKTQKFVMEKMNAWGCDVRQNYRPTLKESKLKINHVHFHILPRWFKDELYENSMKYQDKIFRDLTPELIKELKEKLKK